MKKTSFGMILMLLLIGMLTSAHASLMFYCPYAKQIEAKAESPVELRVLDSKRRVTGLVNGTVVNEIPMSGYADDTVTIYLPTDHYRYEVTGVSEGLYGLTVTVVRGEENITFVAIDIPMSPNATHQYTIDWTVLSQGGEGVTVQIDLSGDGMFEQTLAADGELTADEFMFAVRTADLNKDGAVNIVDMSIVARALGSKPGDTCWNETADLDKNGIINMIDLSIVARDYGKKARA